MYISLYEPIPNLEIMEIQVHRDKQSNSIWETNNMPAEPTIKPQIKLGDTMRKMRTTLLQFSAPAAILFLHYNLRPTVYFVPSYARGIIHDVKFEVSFIHDLPSYYFARFHVRTNV